MKPGDKVCYIPTQENGIIKNTNMLSIGMVHVVYNCSGNWEEYFNYTAELTELKYLEMGWVTEKQYETS